jgi:hypothetical protein
MIDFYSDEEIFENISTSLKTSMVFLFMPLNHIIYKIEHKRSNNYVGRTMHDLIFIGLYFLLTMIQVFLSGATIRFDGGANVVGVLMGLIVFIMFLELAIAIVKRLLKILKWQIF